MSDPVAVDTCTACKGRVVEQTYHQVVAGYETFVGNAPTHVVREYYCADCGIMYRCPPTRMKKLREAHPIVVSKDEVDKILCRDDDEATSGV